MKLFKCMGTWYCPPLVPFQTVSFNNFIVYELGIFILSVVLYGFTSFRVSGCHFFHERLWIYLWLLHPMICMVIRLSVHYSFQTRQNISVVVLNMPSQKVRILQSVGVCTNPLSSDLENLVWHFWCSNNISTSFEFPDLPKPCSAKANGIWWYFLFI